MSKLRKLRTFPAAITKVMGVLTDEGCGEAVNKSASLARKWADPDVEALPSIEQALALDVEYFRSTGLPGPIMEVYAQLYSRQTGNIIHMRHFCLKNTALEIQSGVGALSAGVLAALTPKSENRITLSAAEKAHLTALVDRLKDSLHRAEMVLLHSGTDGTA